MALVDAGALTGLIFDGAWIEPRAGGRIDVLEKATGGLLASVGRAGRADAEQAVAGAALAQRSWAAAPHTERAAVLRRAAQLLERHRTEVAEWIIRESGGVRGKAAFELDAAVDELWVAAALPHQPHGQLLPAVPHRESIARRVPLGVVAVISPWNVPLLLALRALAPALALGNAVVLKPDPRTPVCGGLAIAKLFEAAGLPPGVLHVLPGDAEPGEALVGHERVAMVAFTGSTAVGRRIAERAGRSLKRASLELGGNNAFIVLEDADLDAAASAGAWGSFLHQGQICMAAGRHIVVAEVAEEYLDRLTRRAEKLTVGDPWTEQVDLGPIVDGTQLARVDGIVRGSIAAGALVRTGAEHSGLFYRPTVLERVTPAMPAFTEEIFGPVAPVVVVADEDEAVRVANATDYGLVAAVQTASAERGLALADRLETGIVHINDQTVNDEAFVPFGGRGASGNGHRHGAHTSWEEFTEWQWLTVHRSPVRYPF